jgi:hypothetical protein
LLAGGLIVLAVVMLVLGQWSAALVALAAAVICAVVSWRDRHAGGRGRGTR